MRGDQLCGDNANYLKISQKQWDSNVVAMGCVFRVQNCDAVMSPHHSQARVFLEQGGFSSRLSLPICFFVC